MNWVIIENATEIIPIKSKIRKIKLFVAVLLNWRL